MTKDCLAADSDEPVHPVKILLLDFQMPQMNGVQVVQKVKSHYLQLQAAHKRRIQEPIYIFLTAHAENDSFVTHAKRIGVQEVYQKPLRRQQLR